MEIFAAQGAPPVSLTPVPNKKKFQSVKFYYFFWTPLGSRVSIYIYIFLQVHFKLSAVWYCSHCLPPVSLTPVANWAPVSLIRVAICHWRHLHQGQICCWYHWHKYKFAIGINTTSGTVSKICRRCCWYGWQICHRFVDTGGNFEASVVNTGGATWLANISANFCKKFEITLPLLFSGVLRKIINEKKSEAKNLVTMSL